MKMSTITLSGILDNNEFLAMNYNQTGLITVGIIIVFSIL